MAVRFDWEEIARQRFHVDHAAWSVLMSAPHPGYQRFAFDLWRFCVWVERWWPVPVLYVEGAE